LLTEGRLTLTLSNTVLNGDVQRSMLKDGTDGIVIQYIGIINKMLIYSAFAFEKEGQLNNGNLVELESFVDKIKRKY